MLLHIELDISSIVLKGVTTLTPLWKYNAILQSSDLTSYLARTSYKKIKGMKSTSRPI
jgi:hypothetical protein